MIIQEPVQAAIWHCLNHYDHKDAVFLAERLCSEVESDETVFILATSYYRSNLTHQAYWLLKEKSRRSPQCRYLQAKCAFELKRFAEAECALTNSSGFGDLKNFDEMTKDFGELACFVLQLIAHICLKTERNKLASEALRRALKLNPFMWQVYADLCHLGEQVDASSVFQITSTDIFSTCQGNTNTNSMILLNDSVYNHSNILGNNIATTDNVTKNLNNSSNYILSTPAEQQTQQNSSVMTLHTPNNIINNNNNLNSSVAMLRGNMTGLQNNQNANIMLLDHSPIGYMNDQSAVAPMQTIDCEAGTPFRLNFKYLTAISPITPSFGLLPLHSPNNESSFFGSGSVGAGHNQMSFNANNSPSPQTLAEVNQEQKVAGRRIKGHISGLMNRKDTSSHANTNKLAVFSQTGNITPRTPTGASAAVRRSSRLFGNSAYSVKENNKSPNINSKFVQPRSPPRKTKSRLVKMCLNNELIEDKSSHMKGDNMNEKNSRKEKEKVETITSTRNMEDPKVLLNNSLNNAQTMAHHVLAMKKHSADGLMTLLKNLGEGYKQLAQYQCKAAIKQLETNIPKHHLSSSWVQSLIGVSHYELREYEAAVAIFKRIHEREPFRLDYMEIYSSSLWHLQKEVELSALAQDFMNQDKTSPVTWCVSGNCFSLHKEHETAIQFFKRAVQVDPEFVYSYTLLGHELVLTEELDKAMDYFRAAVVRDPRHYNAWFGIGTIYSKQEKYELAELHYIKALKINPQNSVILVHIGAMQYFMQKKEQALQTLNTAAMLDPKNPLARFHRGSMYFSLGRYQEALRELEELKEIVPKESVVFYLMGKVHKALGNVDSALMHFSWATDLDPKGANNQIKDAFDSVSHPSCCPTINDPSLEGDLEPISERSDDSTQAQQEINYDSDTY